MSMDKRIPSGIKEALKWVYSRVPLRLRLGGQFFRQSRFLKASQWWSTQELENYQSEQLRLLVRHAYEHVPYYHDLFKSIHLHPDDIASTKDLDKIPVLTKDIIRDNPERLRAANFGNKDIVKLYTSGTTGKPLTLYYDKKRDYLNFDPFIWRYFSWAGQNVGGRAAKLSAWTLPPGKVTLYNPVRNLLLLSAYALNETNVGKYTEALKKYNVEYLIGYPSSIELMAQFMKANGMPRPVNLKGVFCHSECLHDWQRVAIEAFWGCQCFDWYGLEERVILGVECEQHKGLHLCSDFGITEFVDDRQSELKKIIATSLTNYAMPMIRYDTGDAGYLLDERCPCNRGFPLFRLQGGREKSFAVGADGAHIPVANIDIPNVTEHIVQFQFAQKKRGFMELRIIKKSGFQDADMEKIRKKLEEKFGDNMEIEIVFTEHIHQTKNGKTSIYIKEF
jgi:phenylacetate-CoA ligase